LKRFYINGRTAVFSFEAGAGADLVFLLVLVELDFFVFNVFFWIAMAFSSLSWFAFNV